MQVGVDTLIFCTLKGGIMMNNSQVFGEPKVTVNASRHEWMDLLDYEKRHLYLYGGINNFDDEDYSKDEKLSIADIVRWILRYNTEDLGKPVEKRQPIYLYINCPGGSIYEGWPLISTIKLSKTPVYTVNIGMWASMAFLIGITGHKRFSLPEMLFLMHDGTDGFFGSASKVQDEAEFRKVYNQDVIKKHILSRSNMNEKEYSKLERKEYYFLPEEALEHEFIDKIVTDIDEILGMDITENEDQPRQDSFGKTLQDLRLEQSELH